MEEMYLEDLSNATEVVLEARRRVRAAGGPGDAGVPPVRRGGGDGEALPPGETSPSAGSQHRHRPHRFAGRNRGSASRAAAGAIRIGNAIGAAFTNRRTLGPVEARLAISGGLALLAFAILFALFPRVLAYPVVVLLAWVALSLLYRGFKLLQRGAEDRRHRRTPANP